MHDLDNIVFSLNYLYFSLFEERHASYFLIRIYELVRIVIIAFVIIFWIVIYLWLDFMNLLFSLYDPKIYLNFSITKTFTL